ncbi:MAG: 2-C-methyl-D-erythritol 4-phosphate cytidylyltransferase, partial [bacterium]
EVKTIVVVLSPEDFEGRKKRIEELRIKKAKAIVPGAEMRQDSVYNGLLKISEPFVLVHDAARPVINKLEVLGLLRMLGQYTAVTLASPVRHSLGRVEGISLLDRIPRQNVWELYTPQAFRTDILMRAHTRRRSFGLDFSDDATMMTLLNVPIKVLPVERLNVKVTYPSDLDIVKWQLKSG